MVSGQPGQGKLTARRFPTTANRPPVRPCPIAPCLPLPREWTLALLMAAGLTHGLIARCAGQDPVRTSARAMAPNPPQPLPASRADSLAQSQSESLPESLAPSPANSSPPPQPASDSPGTAPVTATDTATENPAPPLQRFPLRGPPIDYFAPADNSLTRLASQVTAGEISLPPEPHLALPVVLEALGVPVQSQWLVFAKNAAQGRLISPTNPRAVYFHDTISVAFTPGAAALEMSVVDPRRGPLFYALRFSPDAPPRLTRDDNCLACHVSEHTRQVPGFPLRSFVTDPQGKPRHGWSGITDQTPFARRWGGYYVTGDAAGIEHLGNLASADALARFAQTGARIHEVDLALGPAGQRHLRATSDVVPLLLHDHQANFLTLATRVAYEAATGAPLDSVPAFVRVLLLADQPPLPGPILPDPDYRRWFESRPSRATPSLRRLDLQTRLLAAPCSWLVESPLCLELPAAARRAIHRQLRPLFEPPNPPPGWPQWSEAERRQLQELLLQQIFPEGEERPPAQP